MDIDKFAKYDSAFLAVLQNEGKVAPFIDAFFSFLFRKTDFFHIMYEKKERMGFAPGIAYSIVNSIFKKYEELSKKRQKIQAKVKQKELDSKKANESNVNQLPTGDINSESGIISNNLNTMQIDSVMNIGTHPVETFETVESNEDKIENDSSYDTKCNSNKTKDTSQLDESSNKSKSGDISDDDSDEKILRDEFQANPDSYNGAITEKYLWSQEINEVDVTIKVPFHIMKGKDVQVEIGKKNLKVSLKQKCGDFETVIDSPLTWEVNKEESLWSLVPSKHIQIHFEKVQERWWEGLLLNEKPINVRKIDASRPMTDLDEEAQVKIQEMMFNERQKKLGKPTSEEMKVNNMLEKAWDAEGSPFKGTPFDPTRLNISGSPSF